MQRHLRGILAFVLAFAATSSFAAITGVVMTPEGQPIAGARVSIRAFEGTEAARARMLSATPEAVPLASTQTDAKGAFTLDSPKDATVALMLYARGYEPQFRRIERDEEVGAIALPKAEMRKGSVTAGGKAVANANVFLYYGGYEYQAKTDEQGRYEAPDPKRVSSIVVAHPNYAMNDETFLLTGSGSSASILQRTLSAGSAFQGRVVTGEQDTAVAKATISVDGWPLATSGDDGTFTIAHMPSKWKAIVARKDSSLGTRTTTKESPAIIRIAKGATVSGRVTDAKTRVPVAGAVVRVGPRPMGMRSGSDTSVNAITDSKGAYSVVVPAGAYAITASHPGYDFKQADTSAAAGHQASKDLALSPLARVSGVVVDEEKRPVAVAWLSTENADRMGMPRMMMRGANNITFSGPDGRFSLRLSSEEELFVRATKRGLPPVKSEALKLTPGERKTGLVLTIPSGIAVSGLVTDAQGDPLSGVAVRATEAEAGGRGMVMMRTFIGGMPQSEDDVLTASDGTFTMRVKEGTYDFNFKREGYAPKTVRGQNVSVTSSPAIEASLDVAVEISGRVTRNGTGIENVRVMAMAPGIEATTVMTGPDGSFTLSGLAAGSLRLMARKEEDFVNEMRNVTAPAQNVEIDVKAGGRVSGRVVDKSTSKPITSFQAGITVSRSGGGMVMMAPPLLREFTSADGSFTLEGVPSGAISLVASAPGYASARMNLTVEDGKEIEDVEMQLDTGVKLVGRVTGSNGSPLADVNVHVVPSATGNFASGGVDRSTATDSNGEYTIEALEAGDEAVMFMHADYADTRKSVTLKGRETRLDVQLSSGHRVTGTVVTESGAPVADAEVSASSGSGWERARSDANGAFTFESMVPGRYRVSARKTGWAEGVVEDVDVTSGAPVRIVLKTGGTITGRVTGLNAQELSQASVEAFAGRASAGGTVDANGNYRIEGVEAGTVQVRAWAGVGITGSSRRSATQTVELSPGGAAQVDITFRDDIVISGRVSRDGTALQGATVAFFPRGTNTRASGSAPADEQGQYSISGLEEGEYNVMVTDMQRMSPYSTTYTVRGTSTFDINYRTSSLRGRALDASTQESLANVAVSLRNASQTDGVRVNRSAMTDTNGSFVLDSIPPGSYTITASKDGFGNEVRDFYVSDSASEDLELRMSRNTGTTLTVFDERDGRTIAARATVFDVQGRVVDETRFSFGGGGEAEPLKIPVAPGNYTALISANGYAPRNISFQSPSTQRLGLSPGGTLLVRSKHSTAMRVRLIDANGLAYWRSAYSPTASREIVPTPGTTTFPSIAPGTYTLQLLENEVVVESKQITIGEGMTVNEEI